MPPGCSASMSRAPPLQWRAPEVLYPGCSYGWDVAKAGIAKQRSARCATTGKALSPSLRILRGHDMAGDADIRKARFGAEGKRRRRAAGEQSFIGRKPFGCPMRAPVLDRLGIGAKRCSEMIADTRRHQRMRIGDRHQRQRARIGALSGVLRYQSRFRLDVVEIFDDRERLEDGMAVMNEGRHHALGVDKLVARLELLAGEDVDRDFVECQTLQPQGHPDTKRSNRPPKSVDLYAHRDPL